MPIKEGTGNVPQQAFVKWNDPSGTELAAINRDGTIFTQGIEYPDGTKQATGSVPVVQASLQVENTDVPQSLSTVPLTNSLYTISITVECAGDGLLTDTLICTLTWSDLSVPTDVNSIAFSMIGNVKQIQMETYPISAKSGTAVTFATTFGGTPVHYDLNIRMVQMP